MKVNNVLRGIAIGASVFVSASSYAAPAPTRVEVINTPNVNATIVNTPSVEIANSPRNPVSVADVTKKPIEKIQVGSSCSSPPSGSGCDMVPFYEVPAGKRLVIEDVSISSVVKPGRAIFARIRTHVNGDQNEHYFGSDVLPAGYLNPAPVSGGRQTRIYADPSTNVDVFFTTPDGGVFYLTINGYLETI
jgi:hypothetical protein